MLRRPQESDLLPVRRPDRAQILRYAGGETGQRTAFDVADIDIRVVVALSSPNECDFLAIGRKRRLLLIALETRQRNRVNSLESAPNARAQIVPSKYGTRSHHHCHRCDKNE